MFKMSFLQMHTNAALKQNKTLRASTPYKHTKNIGIIFTVEDRQKHDDVKELIKRFEQDGKQVNVLEFLPKDKDNYEFLFDFFSEKDLSFWGKISSERAEKFSDMQFDYLFSIDCKSNPLVLNVLAHSRAHCRVGCYNEQESPFYELMIDHQGATKTLMNNMYNYTKQLK